MRIFVISLPTDHGRREMLRRRFERRYEEFEFVDAVDGRNLPAHEYFSYIVCSFRKYLTLMTPGEVGCALSHLKVYEKMVQEGIEHALVLEDDVIGTDQDIDLIEKDVPELLKNFGNNFVWIVGGMERKDPTNLVRCFAKRTTVPAVYRISEFGKNFIYGTVCYVVTRESAGWILEKQKECLTVADFWSILLERKIKLFYSDILKHPEDDSSKIGEDRKISRLRTAELLRNSLKIATKRSTIRIRKCLSSVIRTGVRRPQTVPPQGDSGRQSG